jgi:anti-anti-sigma regulatory factor
MSYEHTGLRYEKDVPVIDLGEDLGKTVTEYTKQLIKEGKKCAVLNFEGIDYIRSMAIAQLMSSYLLLKEVNNNGDTTFLGICNLKDKTRKVLEMVGMLKNDGISIKSSLDEAVAELAQQQ